MKILQKMGYTQGQISGDPHQLGGMWISQNGKILYEHRDAFKGNCPVYEAVLRACGASEELIKNSSIKDPSGKEYTIKIQEKDDDKVSVSKAAQKLRRRSMISVRSKITAVTGKEKITPREKKNNLILPDKMTDGKSADNQLTGSGKQPKLLPKSNQIALDHSVSLLDLPILEQSTPQKLNVKGMGHAIKTLVAPKRGKKIWESKEKEKEKPVHSESSESEDEAEKSEKYEKNEKSEKKKI